MRSHHERFRWTHATRNAKDAREVKENERVVNELNSYRALAIVDKKPYTTVIDNLRTWEKDAIYNVVSPNRSGDGFSATGLTLSSPENHRVAKPSADEQLYAINFGRLIGSLQGGKILTIPSAEHLTGAIPVVDTEFPGEMFYYIPAQIEPLAMNRAYFEDKPSFIVMKSGEMPSYVFWKRKAEFPPSYTASQLLDHSRTVRSAAPTPEPRSAPVAGPATEPSTASLAVNTEKATRVAREKQVEPEWEVFDPRLEENPLEFLDYYNACLNGRKGVRSKLMLREVDIDRVNYISPCLAHNHKQTDKEAGTATVDTTAMDIDPVPSLSAPGLPTAPVPDPSKAAAPKPWKQPEPISADDPAWKNFFARIDREKEIRDARIRPKPVFTSEYCNAPGTKSDPKKAVLTRELYDKLYHRAVTANREIENRSKCCFACGIEWTLCPTTRYVHYKQHREEFKLHRTHFLKSHLYVDDPLRVQDLDAAKAPMPKGVPSLNWFRDLEHKILCMENELLEREQLCRICDAHVDFADENNSDHYLKHKEERKQLRVLGDKIPSVPHTPSPKVLGGFEESPEARIWSGYTGKPLPEYYTRIEEKQKAAKKQAQELADTMETSTQQPRETGGIQNPIQISSDVSSSAASDDLEDIFMAGLDGPIHSDVIGSTTAPFAFPPLFEKMPVPEASTSEKVNLDFLSGKEANTIAPLKPEQASPFSRFKGKERRSARQNQELYSDVMDIDAVEAHLDVPIEIEDDDDDLYAYPSPAPSGSAVQDKADFDRQEIIQAIRTNSGELLALNDDSEDAEVVPHEFEIDDSEDAEDTDSSEDEDNNEDDDDDANEDDDDDDANEDDDDDANGDAEANQDEAGNDDEADDGDEHANNNDDEDGSEDEDNVPFSKYPLSGGGFVIDEITEAATGDLPLTPTERSKAREFVQEMVEEALASPDQTDEVATKQRVQTLTRNLFVPQGTEKLDAAKILASATGNNKLRKMNLNLAEAFSAISYVDNLIQVSNGVYGAWGNTIVSSEQEILKKLVDHIDIIKKRSIIQRGPKAAPVKRTGHDLEDVYLNTSDLLNGIRLELYDLWRVIIKAKEAFDDTVAAKPGKHARSEIMEQIVELTRRALADTWRYGYSDRRFILRPGIPVKHDGLDLEFEDLEIDAMLSEAYQWGCGMNSMRSLAMEAWDQAVGTVKAARASPNISETTRHGILSEVQAFVRSEIKAEKRWRKMKGQRLARQEPPPTPATPAISSAKWSTEALASDTPRTPVSPWSPVDPSNQSPTTPTVSGISDEQDGRDIEFSDLKINRLLTKACKSGCGLNNMQVLSDQAWRVATALQEEAPERSEERRHLIGEIVRQFVRHAIKAEKRSRRKQGQQESPATPTSSSAQWSTKAVDGRAPVNKRPSPLPTSRKRKASDTSFHPGPPTPFNPDEVSPRLPKMPRRSKDPLYRPGPALPSPTTPPATPKVNKRSSTPKSAARAAKKVEKKLKKTQAKRVEKKQAQKAEEKEAKKVSFETAQSSKAFTSSSSKDASPQVVITKKPTKKTTPAAPAKTVAPKSSKKAVKKAAPKAGVKKTTAKTKKSKTVAPTARPKRQAAIEAEKSFGKTKVVG